MVAADRSIGLRLCGRMLDARPGTGASLASRKFEHLVLGRDFALNRGRNRYRVGRRSVRFPCRVPGPHFKNLSSNAASPTYAPRRSPLFGFLCVGEVSNGARAASISVGNVVGTAYPQDPL